MKKLDEIMIEAARELAHKLAEAGSEYHLEVHQMTGGWWIEVTQEKRRDE